MLLMRTIDGGVEASGGEQQLRWYVSLQALEAALVGLFTCIRRTWCCGQAAGGEQLLRLGVELQALGA